MGLVPAAGRASRVQPIPCSKEIYPVGRWHLPGGGGPRPKVASHVLLDAMRRAGADRAYVILREGKWDIPAYLRDGSPISMRLAYVMARLPYGVPYTLDQAYPFVRDSLVLLGLPDVLFRPPTVFQELRRRQDRTGADVILGLFRAREPAIMDMVELNERDHVESVIVKPSRTRLDHAWLTAVWTPTFTEYLHEYVRNDEALRSQGAGFPMHDGKTEEIWLGDVFQAAITDGLFILGQEFPDGWYVDLGDPAVLTDLSPTLSRLDTVQESNAKRLSVEKPSPS